MPRSGILIALLVGLALLMAVNAPPVLCQDEAQSDCRFQAKNVEAWTESLMPMFKQAAEKHDIPLELLLTVGYFGSHFENRGDAPTVEGGYGVMALRDNNFMGANSLGEAAALTKSSKSDLKFKARGNINAAAAVLSAYANKMKIDRSQGLAAWVPVIVKFAGLDEENSKFFAAEIYERLMLGLDYTNNAGERFSYAPQEIGAVDLSDLFPRGASVSPEDWDARRSADKKALNGDGGIGILSTDYGPAIWDPAPSCNFSYSQYNKTTVVIHTIQGSAAGARSWMKNCNSNVTSHYVTSEAGGVWQMVREMYTAWHAGCANSYSLGIENEGYAESSSHPTSLYNCAGLLTRDMCNSWGIVKEHRSCPPGVLGHNNINNCVCGGTHWDPGGGWNWTYFMEVVRGAPAPPPTPTWAATYRAQSYPTSMVAGSTAIVWAEFNNTGTGTWGHDTVRLGTSSPQDRSSPFCNTPNWLGCNRPSEVDQSAVSNGQVGRFTFILKAPATPGTYTEKFKLVREGVTWFGPEITWTITVKAATGNISGTVTRSGSGEAVPWATVAVSGGPSTTANASGQYSFTGLNAATYTVTASKAGYNTQSASVTVTAGSTTTRNFALVPSETTAPTVPTGLTAIATTSTKISLDWTASSDNVGVTGYKIFRGGVQIGTAPNADGYTDTTCAPATAYTYTVSAYDAAGNNSAQSAPASATTPPAEIIIDNPACELSGWEWAVGTASADKYGADYLYGSTQPTETRSAIWRPNFAFGGAYDVYAWWTQGSLRATNTPYTIAYYGGSATVNVNQQANGGRWNLLRSGNVFAAGTTGYVKIGNGTGATGFTVVADAVRFVTVSVDNGPDTQAPSVPTNLLATLVSPTQVDLTWSGSSDNVAVTGYKIYRNGEYLATKTGGTSYSDTTVVANVNYTYTVSAFDAANNESAQSAPASTKGMDEFRAFWVDAWGSGYENATATATMLDYVQSSNANAVLVEMRKRGDAYYASTLEPTGTNVTPAAGYDSLADIVTQAHARNLEAHAWVVVNRVWTSQTAPPSTSPQHVFNAHPEWFSRSDTGSMFYGDDSWLDPGHPEVENFLTNVFMEMVENYAIDGLTLDYIRYPSTSFGYNPTAVARYNAEYGTTGNPSPGDSRWLNWRRDQITNIVKRVYLESKAVKPSIKIGAAVWKTAASGNAGYLQNWDQWMANHWLDYACPMNYTTDNADYDGNNQDSLDRQYGRHIYPAQGSYMNTISNSMDQILSAQDLGFPGVSLYTYRVTNSGTVDRTGFQTALVSGPFSAPRNAAAMSWIDSPTLGMLKGFVKNGAGVAVYPATVTIQGESTKNSGTGFYGFVDLTPGTYTVTASAPGFVNASAQVTITAGAVANLDIVLGADTTAPVISGVGTQKLWASNVQIVWDTNEGASSQVEYGLTTSYGSQTTLDGQLVTNHLVQLAGLSANTLYHYRVKSQDGAGNLATSGDFTFTTIGSDVVADLIIDNPQATLVGSWFTGTASADKYGADYYYATSAATETKSAKWTPTIIVAGTYDISVWYPQGANRSAAAPYTVYYNGGSHTYNVNQQSNGGKWNLLGRHPFAVGTAGYVKVHNGTNEGTLSIMADAIKLVYTDTTAPSVPTDLTATAASETQADLTWTASTDNLGVTGYKIFRDDVQIGTSATASYSDTTCEKRTRYIYEVLAYDAVGNESARSEPTEILMPGADTEPPSVPEIVSANGTSATQIDLAWTTSTDNVEVTGYKIYRGGVEVGTSTTTSYSDTGLSEYTTYSYQVSAYDAEDNESAKSNPYEGRTLDATPPSVPAGLAATPVSETRINLSWTASTDNVGVASYRVYRDGTEIAVVTTNSYSDLACIPATTYSYQVAAEDADHNLSALCAAVQGTTTADVTPPTVPTGVAATAVSRSQVNLTWNASTDFVGVTGYKVFRGGVEIATVAGTSYSNTGLWGNTQYSYTVAAFDAKGNISAQSSAAVVTTPSVTDIIMDNPLGVYVGAWTSGTSTAGKYGADYVFRSTAVTETGTATFTPPIDVSGYYTVSCWYTSGTNRATNAPYTVVWDGGQQTVNINQQAGGGAWVTLLTNRRMLQGSANSVKLSNGTGATGFIVVADAVRFQLVSSDLTAPSVPTNLSATAASASQINLSWTASSDNVGVTGYKIYRNDVQIGTSATTSYQSTGLSQYTTYTYKVAAYDAMGNTSAQSSPASATTWDGQAPTVPTGLTGHVIGPRRVSLNWNVSTDNVGVTGYNVYRNGVFLTTSVDNICESGFLTPSTTYTYNVSAYDARGNTSGQSTSFQITTPAYANIIIDNPAATFTGSWSTSTSTGKYGADFRYGSTAVTESRTAIWRPNIAYAGYYDTYIWYAQGTNRATNAKFTLYWDGGSQLVNWNQTTNGGAWRLFLGNKHFAIGTAGYLKLGNGTGSTGKIVVADAARFQQINGD